MQRLLGPALALFMLISASARGQVYGQMPIKGVYTPFGFGGNAVAYAPNGKTIAVASGSPGGLQLFTAAGAFIKCLPSAQFAVSQVAFSPDGTELLDGGFDGPATSSSSVIELWNVATGALLWRVNLADAAVYAVSFSPSGTSIVDGGAHVSFGAPTGLLESRSALTGTVSTTYAIAPITQVESTACAPNGKTIAASGVTANSAAISIFDVGSSAPAKAIPTAATAYVSSLAFSPDSKTLYDSGYSFNQSFNAVTFWETWNLTTGESVRSVVITGQGLYPLALSPNGRTIAVGQAGPQNPSYVNLYDSASGKITASVDTEENRIGALAFSPDSLTLAAVGSRQVGGGYVADFELRNTSTGALLASPSLAITQNVTAVAFSPDESALVALGTSLSIWNVADGSLRSIFNASPSQGASAVAYSPDGSLVACEADGGIQLWSTASGKLLTTMKSAAGAIFSMAFSKNGKYFVDGGAGAAEVWNIPNGKLRYSLATKARTVDSVAFSSDNSTVAVGGWGVANSEEIGVAELWNATTGQLVRSLPTAVTGNGVVSVAISPDGTTLVDVGYAPFATQSLEFWNIATGAKLADLNPGIPSVLALAYEPDGKVVFGATQFGALLAFGTRQYAQIGAYLQDSVYGLSSLAVSASGRYLAGNPVPDGDGAGFAINLNPYYGYVPVSGLTLLPSHVLGTMSSVGTVTISGPAPSYANIVSLSSGSSSAVVPPFVTIPPGQNSATFPITTTAVKTGTPVTITASSDGIKSTAPLTITSLQKLTLGHATAVGGASVVGTLILTNPALPGGETISLSSNSAAASVPTSVFIAAGASSASFVVTTSPVSSVSPATISASLADVNLTAPVGVLPAVLTNFSLSRSSVVGGSTTAVTGFVSLSGPAMAGGIRLR